MQSSQPLEADKPLPMNEYRAVIAQALQKSPEELALILQQVQAARANGTFSATSVTTGTALYQLADNMMEKDLVSNFGQCNLGGESNKNQEKQTGQDKMDVDCQNQASPPQSRQWSSRSYGSTGQGHGVWQ